MNSLFRLGGYLVGSAIGSAIAGAQEFGVQPLPGSSPWTFDIGGQLAQPVGEFRGQVKRAWGLGASVQRHFQRFPILQIRGDAAWLNYGNETKRVPLSPTLNRVVVDMHTMNNIALMTVGPELIVSQGPIRPYAYAFAGYSYFYTESSAGDDNGANSFASSTNFGDGGLASGWGVGARVPVAFRRVSVALDGGARMTRNGVRSYLRRGDIIDQPDGSLLFNRRTTGANFWQYHLGVSFEPRSH